MTENLDPRFDELIERHHYDALASALDAASIELEARLFGADDNDVRRVINRMKDQALACDDYLDGLKVVIATVEKWRD